MLVTVIDSDTANNELGVAFRRSRSGPERELVDWFLETLPIRIPRGCRATVFCEPRLESGFPDLVAVVWNVSTAERWNDARTALSREDLRLAHYLHQAGRSDAETLRRVLNRNVLPNLDRLEAAELVRRTRDEWVPRAMSWSFAARRIIAIEAKVHEWAAALDQAVLNTWFASESYVLVPHVPRGERLVEAATPLGIGVCTKSDGSMAAPKSHTGNLPRSYASWLLNDWAWRAWHTTK